MLYQIIPPILVILSVTGIIIFLIKKTPEINRLEQEERRKKERELRADNETNSFNIENNQSRMTAKLKQGSLFFLEKSVKKSQIVFLKLENKMKNLGEGIRKKRNGKSAEVVSEDNSLLKREDAPAVKFVAKEKEALDGIIDRLGKHNTKKMSIREKLGLKQKAKEDEVEEKYFRPIISDRVVVPKRRRETKNRLEELLIERIAANPKDIEAYERLGEYYLEVKNLEHSKECFKQVLRLNPTNYNARYKIKKLERILGS